MHQNVQCIMRLHNNNNKLVSSHYVPHAHGFQASSHIPSSILCHLLTCSFIVLVMRISSSTQTWRNRIERSVQDYSFSHQKANLSGLCFVSIGSSTKTQTKSALRWPQAPMHLQGRVPRRDWVWGWQGFGTLWFKIQPLVLQELGTASEKIEVYQSMHTWRISQPFSSPSPGTKAFC